MSTRSPAATRRRPGPAPTAASTVHHPLTDQQQAIVDAVASGRNVVVKALAGTGKTSTLAAVARHLQKTAPDRRLLYLAFNKATADEAQSRMPSNVEALTSNAMAHRSVPRHMSRRMKPKALRPRDLVEQLGISQDVYAAGYRLATPLDLARLVARAMELWCQSADDQPGADHVPGPSASSNSGLPAMLTAIAQRAVAGAAAASKAEAGEVAVTAAWGQVVERVLKIVRAWWRRVIDPAGTIQVSFDQEVKFWALQGTQFDQPGSGARATVDIVLLDEAQDTNKVLGALVAAQQIQQVYVGDRNQQIYSWRGSVDFLDKADAGDALALTASWRFGPQVAAHANAFLDLIGTDERVQGNGPSARVGRIAAPDAIVCRTNAGLLESAVQMDASGRRVGVPKGMKLELTILAETVAWLMGAHRRPMTVHADLSEFSSWSEVEQEAIEDTTGPVARLVKLVSTIPIRALLALVDRIVDVDPTSGAGRNWDVMVTTAHKAKGLEWDAVRIADDFPQPRTDDEGEVTVPDAENLRLAYVSVTRAKKALEVGSLAYGMKLTGGQAPAEPNLAEPAAAAEGTTDLLSVLRTATGHMDSDILRLIADHDSQVRALERKAIANELADYARDYGRPDVELAAELVRAGA